ncbi:MAG: YpdA family putative bacillithiol disulfide reductase [Caldithrix sp.]|nr:YpdA family putative bacillithiol disulfide reductase [Caldithrix sp.]
MYDIIIIGAGPIGLACAIEAKKQGYNVLILEKGLLVNSLYHFPTNMTFFSTSQLLEIGDVPFISHSDKPTRREALEYFRRVVQSWDLPIKLYEGVSGLHKEATGYRVETSKSHYTTRFVIVATGFYDTPNRLDVPGENLPKVKHYYDEPHPYVQQNIAVIGAGNSAADVALETYLKGSQVTMVIRESTLKSGVKYWIKPNIENRIKEGSIKAYFNSKVIAIRENEIDIQTPQGPVTLPNDFVLAMTGYRPNYSFLRQLGLTINDDEDQAPYHDPNSFETNLDGVYLAGVVCGGLNTSKWFIENGREHAESIMASIIQKG